MLWPPAFSAVHQALTHADVMIRAGESLKNFSTGGVGALACVACLVNIHLRWPLDHHLQQWHKGDDDLRYKMIKVLL